MTNREARLYALRDITRVLSDLNYRVEGTVLAFRANKYISDKDKMKIAREYSNILGGLYRRMDRAEGF